MDEGVPLLDTGGAVALPAGVQDLEPLVHPPVAVALHQPVARAGAAEPPAGRGAASASQSQPGQRPRVPQTAGVAGGAPAAASQPDAGLPALGQRLRPLLSLHPPPALSGSQLGHRHPAFQLPGADRAAGGRSPRPDP